MPQGKSPNNGLIYLLFVPVTLIGMLGFENIFWTTVVGSNKKQ